MCRGVVYVITGLHKIEYLQRIYRHIIPLLKMFGKSNFQNKSSSWNQITRSGFGKGQASFHVCLSSEQVV